MHGTVERDVSFDAITGRLRGRLTSPVGKGWGAVVLSHGRHEDMNSPLLVALARGASDLGLWSLRFNFAFADAGSDPSGGTADEIAELREAITVARATCQVETTFVAGRGLGAWASIAAATDERTDGAILLGPSYAGQPERRIAFGRLAEFEIPTLVLVGSESNRTDLPLLKQLLDSMPNVNLEVLAGADHRFRSTAGRPMTEALLFPVEAWLRLRKEEQLE
jgi:predicted alpha/beta-hydrolase family hydrolase